MQNFVLPRAATALFIGLAFVSGRRALDSTPGSPETLSSGAPAVEESIPRINAGPVAQAYDEVADGAGTIYGRVTTIAGEVYEGRLRFGGDEEALWINTFDGFKHENPWIKYVPSDRTPVRRRSVRLFGVELTSSTEPLDLARPLMVRFGDIRRIDSSLSEIRVSMKSGLVHVADRFGADDFADGLRVWDAEHGIVDLGEWKIRSIEFMSAKSISAQPRASDGRAAPAAGAAARDIPPPPLYGTVHSRTGRFTGFIQWDREACLGSDEFVGYDGNGEARVQFGDIRFVARRGPDSAALTLRDGHQFVLSGSRHAGHGHRGIYVSDERYGRVLVSWDAFERIELAAGPAAPSYEDFEVSRLLMGHVSTDSGERLTGRIVFDLDESQTVETLDAPVDGTDYSLHFGLIASIEPGHTNEDARSTVRLRNGEVLRLESAGDLGELNAGLLVFPDGSTRPRYVSWGDVERIEFDGPSD